MITGERGEGARARRRSSGNFYDAVDLAKERGRAIRASRASSTRPTSAARFLEQLMGDAAGAVAEAVAEPASGARPGPRRQPGVYFLAR